MPIPPAKRTGAEAVITKMVERLQVTREDILAFLEVGRHIDLADPPPGKPMKDDGESEKPQRP